MKTCRSRAREAWCDGQMPQSSCDLISVAGASHRVENWYPSQWTYKTQLVEWLNRVLGPGAYASTMLRLRGIDNASRVGPGLVKNITYDETLDLTLDAWLPTRLRQSRRWFSSTAAAGKPATR